MDNLLIYLVVGIVFVLFVLARRKKHVDLKDLTPELFVRQRAKILMPDYIKWLRYQYAYFGAEALERKEKGLSIPQALIDGLRMIEKEMEDFGNRFGKPILGEKRISEEFRQEEGSVI